MGSVGRAKRIVSCFMTGDQGQSEDGISDGVGSARGTLVSAQKQSTHQRSNAKKSRLSETALLLNADRLLTQYGAQEPEPRIMDTALFADVEKCLKAAREENAKLQTDNDSLIKSLFVKSDILKATLAAKKMFASLSLLELPADQSTDVQDRKKAHEDEEWSSPSFDNMDTKNEKQDSLNSDTAVVAAAAATGYASSLDSPEVTPATFGCGESPTKSVKNKKFSNNSFHRFSSDINCSDVTSSLIEIRNHRGDLKLLLQEADEEGLSNDLMASIESTVAETSKIYTDLMEQRRLNPLVNRAITGELCLKSSVLRLESEKEKQQTTKIAVAIQERLSQQALMTLYGSWQAQCQKLEVIKQKQARLEVMRASIAGVVQDRSGASQSNSNSDGGSGSRGGSSGGGAVGGDLNMSWKGRAQLFLASEYLEKAASDVYWEEWDAVNTFEKTCCEILGAYNTAIMYAEINPASLNCAAIAKEVLSLATIRGRLCLAT